KRQSLSAPTQDRELQEYDALEKAPLFRCRIHLHASDSTEWPELLPKYAWAIKYIPGRWPQPRYRTETSRRCNHRDPHEKAFAPLAISDEAANRPTTETAGRAPLRVGFANPGAFVKAGR